jgi:molybdopterin/thiamine biosynthesis adenylyltransferase
LSQFTGKHGTVYVTDMDQIEKSNLSRQFLFRNTDINRPKSTTAVRAVTAMNPAFHAVAYESKVRVLAPCISYCTVGFGGLTVYCD